MRRSIICPAAEAELATPHGKADKSTLLLRVNTLMQDATSRGDYREVQRLARIAEELSLLEKKEKEITQSRENLASMLDHRPEKKIDNDKVSARERGNRVRRHYVENVLPSQGIHLEETATKRYRTNDGRKVGMTYAKELEIRPSFWFLGLADEHYDSVILLCESSEDSGAEIAALVFPAEFVKRIWKGLSRSKGQVKFHVARTGYMSFEIRLPGSHPLNVSQYLNAVRPLSTFDGSK